MQRRIEIDQPKGLASGADGLAGFSLDQLVRFLVLLGSGVAIVVSRALERAPKGPLECL